MPSCTRTSATWCARGSALRVWIVSPTTCMATLHTLRAVLKDARLRAEAHAIRRELGLLYKRRRAAGGAGRQPRPAFRPGAEGHRGDQDLRRPGAGPGAAAGGDRLRAGGRAPRQPVPGARTWTRLSALAADAMLRRAGVAGSRRAPSGDSPWRSSPSTTIPAAIALVNELHARPFPELTAPCRAVHLAIKQPENAADRDRDARPGASRWRCSTATARRIRRRARATTPGRSGAGFLKWELHTEFVTYTLFADGVGPKPFSGELFELFPADWLAEAPGSGGDLVPRADRDAPSRRRSRRGSTATCRSGSCRRASRSAGWWTARR